MSEWRKKRLAKARERAKNRMEGTASVLTTYFGLDKTKTVLDIGCGQHLGELSNYIANYSKNVVGIDINEDWIKEAKKKKGKNVEFLVANAEKMPLKDNSVDIAICTWVIEHVERPEKMLSEIKRVLKKDGMLYLTTANNLWPVEPHYELPLYQFLPNFLQRKYRSVTKRDYDYGFIKLFYYPSLKRLLRGNGFLQEDLTFEILANMRKLGMKSDRGGNKLEGLCKLIRRTPRFFQGFLLLFFPVWLIKVKSE